MRTATTPPPRRPIAALSLLCACMILLPACRSVSTRPEIAPTPPRVDCQKPATPPLGPVPVEQVSCDANGCRLSEPFAKYVLGLFGTIDDERKLRAGTNDCLDEHERRGIIIQ
jgi:hypothetical protein